MPASTGPKGPAKVDQARAQSQLAQHRIARQDVKRIAVLAGSIFVVIIILSFVLPAVGL